MPFNVTQFITIYKDEISLTVKVMVIDVNMVGEREDASERHKDWGVMTSS